MGRKKREHVLELYAMPNVFMKPDGIKGHWHESYFKNQNPITLEVGCGKGEYTVNLGLRYPNRNFVGLDAKGPRVWTGAKASLDAKISNTAFLCSLAELIPDYFAPGEVSEIWVTFPDPQPKPSREQQRLVSGRFLECYGKILEPGGHIHFKTDNDALFDWAVQSFEANSGVKLLRCSYNVHKDMDTNDITSIETKYERLFRDKGETIKYAELVMA